ncbi:MAG: PAS domain-containing protein [wastewater metagenome]|nr:PAS domain-containing protein [Candidatus Loosdrechtia aerotolerans]
MTSPEKKLYQRLKFLSDAFLLSSKNLDYKSVLRTATKHFRVFTGADASVIMLSNDGNLIPVSSLGIPLSQIKDISLPLSTRLKDILSRPALDVRYASFMNTPLIQNRKLIGLSAVFSTLPEKFALFEHNKYEHLLLTMLASYIAVTIENASQINSFKVIEQSKSEWEGALDTIDDLISIHDADFNIIRANMAVAKKFNKDIKEIIGKKCYKIFHGTDEPWKTCPHRKSLETMTKCSEEIEDPHMGGVFNITTFPCYNDAGKYRSTIHITKDITEHKKMWNQQENALYQNRKNK